MARSAEVESREDPEDLQGLDPESLKEDLYYRWIHVRPQRIARMKSKGFRFAVPGEDARTLTDEDQETADGRLVNGDTVLMVCPKKTHEQSRAKVAKVTRARLAAPKQQFKKKAAEGGVEVTTKKDKDE